MQLFISPLLFPFSQSASPRLFSDASLLFPENVIASASMQGRPEHDDPIDRMMIQLIA